MTAPSRFTLSMRGEFLLALILVIFTAISIRLTEFPLWQNDALQVNGERLMATHDAYTWLAGAKGVGNYVDHAFTNILAATSSISGTSPAAVGFWSPILFVPLLAIPICLLARFLRLPEGGLVFGILATSGLGYLVRTRLGFADTDVISLLFPVSMACALAIWMDAMIARGRGGTAGEPARDMPPAAVAALALGVGLLGKAAIVVYPSNKSIVLATYALAVLIGLVAVGKGGRQPFWASFILMYGATFGGWAGGILAGGWALWCVLKPNVIKGKYLVISMIGIGAAVLALSNIHELVWLAVERLFFYAKTSAPDLNNATAALKLPEIAQSVREAQNLDWASLGPRMGGNWVVFIMGLAGFGLVVWRKPALLVFLPFLLLGLGSVKLGNRFSMYGTVGVGMGMGLGLSEFLRMFRQSQGRRWIAQLSMACVALWPSADFMGEVAPVPVLPKVYAQTFVDLKGVTEPDALLWQWWDYGYAAQYYAERATMGDGARQSGPWLYPLARVHCAESPRQAAQLMRYFGQAVLEAGSKNTANTRKALFTGNPVAEIQKMDAPSARQFLLDLGKTEEDASTTVQNYFVVSWENLRLAGWIGYYGNWDVVSGTSAPGKMQQVRGEIRIDSSAGSLMVNGDALPIDSMDVVEPDGTRHFEWPNGSGSHVLINQAARQVFLMDHKMYRSMMVRMLIGDPKDFSDEFSLVVDNYPWARAYKVK